MPCFPTRDTPGLFARSVDDLMLLDSVLTDDWELPELEHRLRLGIPGDYFLSDLADEVAVATEMEFEWLEKFGFVLVEAPPPDFATVISEAAGPIRAWELPRSMGDYLEACANGVRFDDVVSGIAGPYVRDEFEDALKSVDAARLSEAYQKVLAEVLPQHRQIYCEYLRKNNLDAIVFPTVPLAPTKLGDNVTTTLNGSPISIWHTMRNTLPATFYGAPGISVPFARTPTGLPLGLEFDGAPGADRKLLKVAATWAQSLK